MWLDDGLAFQKVKGKVFLSMDLTLSLKRPSLWYFVVEALCIF